MSTDDHLDHTIEDSIVELKARVTQLEEEVCNLNEKIYLICEGLYRVGMSANSCSYIPYTNEQTDSLSKDINETKEIKR